MSKIQSIKVYTHKDDQDRDTQLLHLLDEQGRRLNIYVGLSEALQIDLQLKGETTPRPMTCQLVTSILDGFGLKISRVDLTELKDNTFFALLTIEGAGQLKTFDARPSDAIALALAAGAEVHVHDQVLDAVGPIEEPGPTFLPFETRIKG